MKIKKLNQSTWLSILIRIIIGIVSMQLIILLIRMCIGIFSDEYGIASDLWYLTFPMIFGIIVYIAWLCIYEVFHDENYRHIWLINDYIDDYCNKKNREYSMSDYEKLHNETTDIINFIFNEKYEIETKKDAIKKLNENNILLKKIFEDIKSYNRFY